MITERMAVVGSKWIQISHGPKGWKIIYWSDHHSGRYKGHYAKRRAFTEGNILYLCYLDGDTLL